MSASSETPPSYDDAMGTLSQLPGSSSHHPIMTNADLLCRIEDGVQLYYITPEGYVSAPSYPSSLSIYLLTDGHHAAASATNCESSQPAFLQVGDWIYPLLPEQSPVLHSNWGSYIFPDVASPVPGSSVGVILPQTVSEVERQHFELLLQSLTNLLHHQSEADTSSSAAAAVASDAVPGVLPADKRTSEKVAGFLTTAGEWLSWGLVKGAEKTGQLVRYGSSKLRENIVPAAQPSVIDPRAQRGAYYAHEATRCAVRVSSFLVDKVSDATAALGRTVAPHIRRHSTKLLPASFTQPTGSGGSSKFDDACDIAASGLKGLGTVFVGLERSAKILARNIADETVQTVEHKYGSDAGQFTEHIVRTAVGATAATYNISNLGIKVVARRAAADSVIAMGLSAAAAAGAQSNTMTDTSEQHTQREHDIPPVYSVNAPVNGASPVDDVLPVDSVTAETDAVAVVNSSK